MSSFSRLANVPASTKRPPPVVGGKRGEPVTHLAELFIMEPMPVDAELSRRLKLETAKEHLQTFAGGNLDIKEGDTLVWDGREYPIRAVGDWPWGNTAYKHLVIEELKQR